MKFRLLALAAITSAIALPGQAQDLASSPVAPVSSPYDWSGFYLGVSGGPISTEATAFGHTRKYGGGALGAHAGFNMQNGNFVFGLEADVSHAFNRQTYFMNALVDVHSGMDWQGSLRGRAGIGLDRTLIYGTAGVAFSSAYGQLDIVGNGGPWDYTRLTGWTVGAGVEQAINDNWVLRGELRYTDYGDDALMPFVPGNHRITEHTTRVGVSFKF